MFTPAENSLVFISTLNIRLNFMASEFFGRQRECRFYTADCGNKMAVSVTGPRAINELGGPVIPGNDYAAGGETSPVFLFTKILTLLVNV